MSFTKLQIETELRHMDSDDINDIIGYGLSVIKERFIEDFKEYVLPKEVQELIKTGKADEAVVLLHKSDGFGLGESLWLVDLYLNTLKCCKNTT